MASDTAMTPQEAMTALASVRGYRERLTAQAAGIVWMAWGLVIAFVGLASQYGPSTPVEGHKEAAITLWALAIGAGALLTNAVWRAHALEQDPGHPRWAPYAAGAAALALVVVGQEAFTGLLHDVLHTRYGYTPLGFAAFNLLPAVGSFTIAALQRTRVRPGLGYAASALYLGLYLVGTFGAWNVGTSAAYFASCFWIGLGLAGYVAIGLRTWAQG